jgi:hypothetical protein
MSVVDVGRHEQIVRRSLVCTALPDGHGHVNKDRQFLPKACKPLASHNAKRVGSFYHVSVRKNMEYKVFLVKCMCSSYPLGIDSTKVYENAESFPLLHF